MAIASRCGIADVVTNFGQPLQPAQTEDPDDEPFAEARMIAALCGDVRVVCVYAPNGRVVGSKFYAAKLVWFERLSAWLEAAAKPTEPLVLGGDLNVAPDGHRRLGPARLPRRHPRLGPGARGLCAPVPVGPRRRLPRAPPGAGALHLVGLPRGHVPQELRDAHRPPARHRAAGRSATIAAEIDREARKGKPIPSDHAPLVIDLDAPGCAFDAGWASAEGRIAARRAR